MNKFERHELRGRPVSVINLISWDLSNHVTNTNPFFSRQFCSERDLFDKSCWIRPLV